MEGNVFSFRGPMSTTTIIVATLFIGLLVLAILFELVRQRRARNRRVQAAWRTVQAIAKEKELTEDERRTLESLIRRWSPNEPARAATVMQHFDSCVEAEMESIRQRGDLAAFERVGTLLRDIRTRLALDFVPVGQRIYSTRELFAPQEAWMAPADETPPRWRRGVVAAVNEAYFEITSTDSPPFRPGQEVRFRIFREDDARYAFTASFVRQDREPPLLLFTHTSELKRIQTREHYRVRHEQATTIGVMNAPVDGLVTSGRERRIVTRLRGKIVNISAGGLAVILPQGLPSQVLMRVNIDLAFEDIAPFDADARIVASNPLTGGRHLIRAAFVGLEEERRDAIARYVMHRQQAPQEVAERVG